MASLRDIKRRIRSIRNTQQITRAMKMVSAAKLRKAQDQILAARPYDDQLRQMIGEILQRERVDLHPLLRPREGDRVLLVIIASDRGLCGGLNTSIFKRASAAIAEQEGSQLELFLVGKRTVQRFGGGRIPVAGELTDLFRDLTIRDAELLARRLIRDYRDHDLDRVELVYPEFKSALVQNIRHTVLLPLRSEAFLESVRPDEDSGEFVIRPPRFEYEPAAADVLSHLLPRHIQSRIWRILLEAQASEHGARMTAMDNATTNAADMLDRLTLQMNRARQASITRELIEIVSGADALEREK